MQYEGKHFLLDLKGKPGGVSFVVVAKPFTIEQEYRHTLEIRALVSQLNQRINFVKFYIGESGATLVMQSHITFLDQLEAQQVRRFLELFNDTLVTIAETAPEAMQYLK